MLLMRKFITFTALICAVAALPPRAADPHYAPPASPGATCNFNPGWKFIREDVTNAEKIDFDDSKWATVSAPHTYNDVDS